MRFKLIFLLSLAAVLHERSRSVAEAAAAASRSGGAWPEVLEIIGFFIDKCLINGNKAVNRPDQSDNPLTIFGDCVRERGLRALDRALRRDVIQINDNVLFVKYKNYTGSSRELRRYKGDWSDGFVDKLRRFFETRLVKIKLRDFPVQLRQEGRHRKHKGFGDMLVFGIVAAGLIVIPMGFQFLAVLGGKALLLSKLALLLTSIQGLKKIATSNVNYGLYTTGQGSGGPWHYDRQWPYESELHHHYTAASPGSHDSYLSSYDSLHPRVDDRIDAS